VVAAAPLPVRLALNTCPAHVRRLEARDLPGAKQAVLSSLPTLARRVHPALELRGARVIGLRLAHVRDDVGPGYRCDDVGRSALVQIFLPAERAAPDLRGNPWFYVARTPSAWVIWFEPH
jgi:hypothetical protein